VSSEEIAKAAVRRYGVKEESFVIRPLEGHEWPTWRDIRLHSLADSPDAFGSTLAAEQDRSPEDWSARLARAADSGHDYPLIAELSGEAVGLVWAKIDAANPTVANVFQMWVAPASRGRGIAATLLREAIRWASSRNVKIVQLGVTCGDTSAVRLYGREGFMAFGPPEPLRPGSALLSQPMRLTL
jgi:GNAT superfamily N-acetyltransferase